MDGDIIRTFDLTKDYGRVHALRKVNLQVRAGEIFGFLGPNGAGKTTTIRTLIDLIRPTAGRATIFGLDPRRDGVDVRRRIGYLPGELGLYERMTGADLLRFLAALRGGIDEPYARALATRFDARLDQPIRSLSHGNRQKIGLLAATIHRPELLILDEPTTGLDPLVQHEFLRFLREVRDEGRTVFLSSHDLSEVEQACDRVGMIREGTLFAVEQVEQLRERALHGLEIRFAEPPPAGAFRRVSGVRDVSIDGSVLRCTVVTTPDDMVKAASHYTVVDLVSHEPTLEEIFLALYTGNGHAA